MAYRIEISETARRALARIDPPQAARIIAFLRERLSSGADPRSLGKPLRGPLRQYWRYRAGDYRVICDIQDEALRVLVLRIGYRKDIYD